VIPDAGPCDALGVKGASRSLASSVLAAAAVAAGCFTTGGVPSGHGSAGAAGVTGTSSSGGMGGGPATAVTVMTLMCSPGDVCGWDLTKGYYNCGLPPALEDPSHPITCGP
jgi:hypothetical protein